MFTKIRRLLAKHPPAYLQQRLDEVCGLGALERLLASNWLNPLATLYLCLRCLSLAQAWRLPIWVYGRPRLTCLSGRVRFEGCAVRSGMVRINESDIRREAPSAMTSQTELILRGEVILRGGGVVGTGNAIKVLLGARLELGEDFLIMDRCVIGVSKSVRIGARLVMAHAAQLMDSSYHYVARLDTGAIPRCIAPVTLGDDCWLCNGSTVSAGSALPDYAILASQSLLTADYSTDEAHGLYAGMPATRRRGDVAFVRDGALQDKLRDHFATTDEPYLMSEGDCVR